MTIEQYMALLQRADDLLEKTSAFLEKAAALKRLYAMGRKEDRNGHH